ncbi:hypothetical protein [Ammoniphilus sp. YIM 78166]|uniref:hypothetical protein n=1 Tax=Ammoniphilus sp. YIM 78166 TaxID=1644106 RepID=UPI00106FEAFA|nr:hypothetical protein [Ammoniphilus sp. YIM 78166]
MELKRILLWGSWAGVVSGSLLGLLLKLVEHYSHIRVYTLLLNVDYIPLLNQFFLPELIEFSLHLLVSVGLSIILLYILEKKEVGKLEGFQVVFVVSLLIGLLLYPTTSLSSRTPALTDGLAWIYWLLGHGLYGGVLGLMLRRRGQEKKSIIRVE